MKYLLFDDKYKKEYIKLIRLLWFDVSDEEINELIEEHRNSNNNIFLAIDKENAIGFLNTSIRTDYVEGSNSSKTGYIEGIFVLESYRKQDIARNLLHKAFEYFQSIEIYEVGSDVELHNTVSASFHEKVGFKEVNRNIHYMIKIDKKK